MSPDDGWNPDQYNRFASEREQPFWDLAALIAPAPSPVVADLGCGDGRLTTELAAFLGAASMTGVDQSSAMLDEATLRSTDAVHFEHGDIAQWHSPDGVDIIFANASLQWVPNHAAVMGSWARSLLPGGQMAVQVPSNADHPSHQIADEMATGLFDEPPVDQVGANVLAPETYAEILDGLGFTNIQVRLHVYLHHLGGTDEVVEWMKGTSLTRFRTGLAAEAWERYIEAYRERLRVVLGDQHPYVYAFKRILMYGRLL